MIRSGKKIAANNSPAKKAGYFITFEGGEGAGKSTQIKRLAGYLRRKGFDVVITREPGGTAGAESIRHILLNSSAQNYGPAMEAILFAAARADHVDELIAPALKKGKIVLCDRFIDSTRVYQGAVGKISQGYITLLEKVAVEDTMPDLTFVLDVPAREGMKRADIRRKSSEVKDRFEQDNISIQEKRRQAFLKIAKKEPVRCHIIDATQPVETIAAEIAQVSDEKIRERTL